MQPHQTPPTTDVPSDDSLSRQLSGKLLLREELPLDEKTFQQFLEQKLITPTTSILTKSLSRQCQRCGNKKKSLFASIPCEICHSTHLYCRKCIEMGRVMACQPLYYWSGEKPVWPVHEDPCTWDGALTHLQQRAADRIAEAIAAREYELLCWAVCGAGKTEMLFPGITKALKLGKRICITTPRADVVRELLPRIRRAYQDVEVEGLYGGSEDKAGNAQLILATTHQLLRYQDAFDVMVIDEIDAFPFHADPSLPFAAERAKTSASTTIYLTATPRRNHRKRLNRRNLPHIFVPVRFHGHPLPVPKLNISFSLKSDLKKAILPQAFQKWTSIRETRKRQLLIFVPAIAMAENLQEPLTQFFLEIGTISQPEQLTAVHAADPDREEKVQQFREKQLHILITTTILERGVTFPSVDVAVLDAGHEVFDEAALVQIAGRAGRSPDDPTGEIVFFHEGKTDAMVQAKEAIRKMNQRGGI